MPGTCYRDGGRWDKSLPPIPGSKGRAPDVVKRHNSRDRDTWHAQNSFGCREIPRENQPDIPGTWRFHSLANLPRANFAQNETQLPPAPYQVKMRRTMLRDRDLVPYDALVGDVGNVLRIVKERDRIVIAAEQEDHAVEVDEPVEHGIAPERVTPGLA